MGIFIRPRWGFLYRGGDLRRRRTSTEAGVLGDAPRRRSTAPPGAARRLVGLALLYLFIPIFIVVLFSFNDNQGRFNFTWQGFTLDHWQHPFADPDLATALKNSVLIALISTAIATALGHVHGAGARALPLPRAVHGRLLRVPAAGLARGRARRGAAGAVPHAGLQHRLRHDRDRPRDVHRLLRGGDREGATGGHGPPHRGGGDGPRGDRVDDVPQGHAADDRAGRRRGGAAGGRDLLRRLRDHDLQRRPDARRSRCSSSARPARACRRGQRAGDARRGRGRGPGGVPGVRALLGARPARPRAGCRSPRRTPR